jgi:hypothetical protein
VLTLLKLLSSQSCHNVFSEESTNMYSFTTMLKCVNCNLVYSKTVNKIELQNQAHPKMHEWFFKDQAYDLFMFLPCTYLEPGSKIARVSG